MLITPHLVVFVINYDIVIQHHKLYYKPLGLNGRRGSLIMAVDRRNM
jgi:hypothetical protein